MVAQPNATHLSAESSDPLYLLDHITLSPTRVSRVSGAISSLVKALGPEDLAVLSNLHACASLLVAGAGQAGNTNSGPTGPKPDVTLTLLQWERQKLKAGPALNCLTAILTNAALDPNRSLDTAERGHIARLSQIIRGALVRGSGADLLVLVGGADGVRGLVRHVDEKLEQSKRVHVSFATLWKRWLRDRITGWMLEEPARLHHVLDSVAPLQPALDAPAVDLWSDGEPDADEQPSGSSIAVSGEGFEGLSARDSHDRATALQFLRGRAYGGLTLLPDHYVPDELVRRIVTAALSVANSAVARGMYPRAEQMLALAFVSATGLRGIDLQDVVWDASDASGSLFLDPRQPVLSVPLKRPINAVNPFALAGQLRPVAERFDWPIPPSLHAALRRLVFSDSPTPGSPVFSRSAGLGRPSAQLLDAVSELVPGAQVGTGRIRIALAAKLAQRFGPEIAQLVLRDSLFTSLGPAYYCSVPAGKVGAFLSGIQADWFGEPVSYPAAGDVFLGSRLAMRDDMARKWSASLKKKAYSAARKKGSPLESLRAGRDLLAGSLCAATGNRPGGSLGMLRLDSVIPEYGLVILQDKQQDVLRRTRVAVTGRRWVTALRSYLDVMVELSRGHDEQLVAWAAGVLSSIYPLLSLPEGGAVPTPLDAVSLRATMPLELSGVDNFYRHRLNQALQARDVDWELRHAQLGWVVSPAFAMADLSPLSPQILAERLGPVIDDLLVEDGWYSPSQRIVNWSWDGIPMPSLVDWPARVADYERCHERATRHLHQEFKLRRKKAEPIVLQRLAHAVEAYLPMLRVDIGERTLVTAPGYKPHGPVVLTPEHYALLRDHVRNGLGDLFSAVDGLVTERLINELVVHAVRQKVAVGPEPIYHHVGFTSQLSPFLPGIGLAVRHAMTIRDQLQGIAARDLERDRAGIVQTSILANTPYRDLDRSDLLMRSASRAVRGEAHPGWLRVPARDRKDEVPVVLGGVAAAVLARCGKETPTMRPLPRDKFSSWLAVVLDGAVPLPTDRSTVASMVAETCRIAGLLELDGPGRLVMDGYPLAAVATDRELAENEDWPVRTRSVSEPDFEGATLTKEVKPVVPRHRDFVDVALYTRLTGILNSASSVANEGRKSSSRRGRHQRAERELLDLLGEAGPSSNLGLVIEYVLHRLRFGGKRRKHLKEGTLHKEVTRFARALLSALGTSPLLGLTSEALEATYLAVLCRKPKDSRADVLEEIAKFQRHLEFAHHVPEVTFARLRTFAGPRVRRADKGTFTQAEVELMLTELDADVEREKKRIDASPEAIRLCELRVILYLILEGSGLRPSSVHGLLLGDLHLFGPARDLVHVHTTGGYGEAKTSTSKGFVPCEGALWESQRGRILAWIESEQSKLGDDWWKLPMFGDATGSRRCFGLDYLTSRIHQLGKWASGSLRARAYWLRKRRMTQRLREVLDTPTPTARAMFRVLHASGETDILTPLSNYIHDPAVPLHTYLDVAGRPDRAGALAVAGLRAAPLDMKWHKRRGTTKEFFFGTVFDALGIGFETAPEGRVTEAPVPYRQKPLLPRHIDRYARSLQRFGDRNEAMTQCGVSDIQAERLDDAVRDMVVRNGVALWMLVEIRQPAALMPASRHLRGTEKLFRLLDHRPDAWLVRLADAWLRSGHIERLHDSDVVLMLSGAAECDAARMLLEKTGARLEFQRTSGDSGLLRLPSVDSVDPRRRRNAHGGALRWVLAMCCLYSCLVRPERSQSM